MNENSENTSVPQDGGTRPGAAEGRGARLRAAREAAGLAQEDIAARLRLSLRQVQALEQDEDDALPPAPFVRGFVRNYARTLGRDPADFDIPVVPPEDGPQAPPVSLTPPPHRVLLESGRASANRRWLAAALGALLLGALGSWVRWEHLQTAGDLIAQQAKPSLEQLGEIVGAGRPGGGGAADQTAIPAAPAPAMPAPAAAPAAVVASAPTTSAAPAVAPAAPPATPVPHPAPAIASPAEADARFGGAPARKLALDFDADCWVEVRDENNQVLLSGVSRAGEHRDLEAHGPVRIVVGNAPATRLSWNGRPVDLAEFTRLTVARLTLDPAADHP